MAAVSRVWVALAVLLALLTIAGASTLTVFEGPRCTRNTNTYKCGCSTIKYHGGYSFTYTNGVAKFYNDFGCRGSPAATISNDLWYCSEFNYKSVFINCLRSEDAWDITAEN